MAQRLLRGSTFHFKVALMTLVPVLVLAVVLSKSFTGSMRERALQDAESRALVVERLVGEQRLAATVGGRSGRGRSTTRRELDRTLAPLLRDGAVRALAIVDRQGRTVYSTRPRTIGEQSSSAASATALAGSTAAGIAERAGQETIEAAVPLPSGEQGGRPAGALRVDLPYEPVRAALASDARRLHLILLVGLAALCLGLLRTAVRASSRLRSQAAQTEHQAMRDALTGLPNRALFNRLLEDALSSRRGDGSVAVLLMDLDRFKEINDTLGHFNGDVVIERVGERLRTVVREGDTVARLGGDEFAMLLCGVSSAEAVAATADRVHRALEEPFTAGGLALKVEASIGIALHPQDGDRAGALLRAADVAMYAAKEAHTGHAFYSPDQHQYSPARLGLVAQLARAMDSHELVLHYQPKANLRTGEIDGVEALVRWHHPQRGLLYPGEFIPVTERTSLIRPVTIHLLERALDQICDWEREGRGLSIAVNLSAQILLDLGLPGEIGRMLSRVGAPPERLELEVTESAIMYDPRRTKRVLDELHEMGLRVAIDDFGTGYSSLVSLRTLPISTIKIDKSFVMGMEHDANDAAIVKSTAQLGSNLGLTVVAEGVETPAAWNELKQLGCDYAQGYYLSKPLDSEQFMRWLVAYRGLFEDRLQAPARPRRLPAMAGAGLPAIATGHTGG